VLRGAPLVWWNGSVEGNACSMCGVWSVGLMAISCFEGGRGEEQTEEGGQRGTLEFFLQ